jgi:flagellar biosynthesis/type III secretory pathway protein FliH
VPSRFVSLAAYLQPAAAAETSEVPSEPEHAAAPALPDALVAECAMFRARLREAFELQSEALLADLAADVLARELRLAPVETGAIVARLIETFSSETPVAVRVHPDDVASVHVDLPLETDTALRRGDAVLVVRDGTLESMLGVRLDAVVRAAAQR